MEESLIDGAPASEREIEILRAACRVIARNGAHGLRMDGVAREAGVSKALVHYYFATRQGLLRAAFSYSEQVTWARVDAELPLLESGAERVERFLLLELDEDPLFEENRALWNEAYSSLSRDSELRPTVTEGYRYWVERLRKLIDEGRRDGSITQAADAEQLAWRLAALVDGIESLMRIGLLADEEARALAREILADVLRVDMWRPPTERAAPASERTRR